MEAKRIEIENLMQYDTCEEINENTCEKEKMITSHWIITKKEGHDGQKMKLKTKIVARRFQVKEKPQSDAATVLREGNKMFLALAAANKFELISIDIEATFLPSDDINQVIYVKPPKDIYKQGII